MKKSLVVLVLALGMLNTAWAANTDGLLASCVDESGKLAVGIEDSNGALVAAFSQETPAGTVVTNFPIERTHETAKMIYWGSRQFFLKIDLTSLSPELLEGHLYKGVLKVKGFNNGNSIDMNCQRF